MNLILIGGAQRSGTTLLQTLVANAFNTLILPEAHILCDLLASYKRAKNSEAKTRFFYAADADLLTFFQSCANRHIADIAAKLDFPTALVLKDPNLVQFNAEASAVLPEAIRIVSIRDPRDIAASFLRIGLRERHQGSASKYRRRDIDFIGKKITASYASLMQGSEPPGIHLVRYEELVTKPRQTLEKIAHDAGLELSLDRITNPLWLEREARHDASWISELEGGKPSPASVGAYRTVMWPREIVLLEQICGPVMDWAGYQRSASHLLPAHWSPAEFARSVMSRLRRSY
jgi:hypothetical protein